jgi:hypothetical protein
MSAAALGSLRTGVFTTELLLGADRVCPETRRNYQIFFREVIRQRGFPLHTASLWNALFFGWDLELHSYLGRGLQLSLATSGPAVPVGSFVMVKAGSRVLWAEVIYKEGRDPRVDVWGYAEPVVSGARAGLAATNAPVVVQEGLVLDFDAFGPGINDVSDTLFERATRKGWLTADHHLGVEAHYAPGEAGLDGLTLFARRIMDQYGDSLFDEYLRDDTVRLSHDERWELLLSSLDAVASIAGSTNGLVSFGDYHLDENSYRSRLSSRGDVFDGGEIKSIVRKVATPPEIGPAYLGIGPSIREFLGRNGFTPEEEELMAGPGYARLVLETNRAVADQIGESGLSDGAYVRLDDESEAGGIWRVTAAASPPPEARWHPLSARGLGFASCAGLEPVLSPTADDDGLPLVQASDKGWMATLRRVDVYHQDLPIPRQAIELVDSQADKLVIHFDDGLGVTYQRAMALDRERHLIRGMLYPGTIVVGTVLHCVVGHGGRMVTVRAKPLDVPRDIEGRVIQVEINERIFRGELRLEPVAVQAAQARGRTLADDIAEVFRRRGYPTEDGGRFLSSVEIVAGILGPEFSPEASLPIVLALQSGDYVWREGGYVWYPRLSPRTSPRDRASLAAHREAAGADLERRLAPYRVPMTIVHFYQGQHPSPEKVADYEAALVRYRAFPRLPAKLPVHCTWREPYEVGDVEFYRPEVVVIPRPPGHCAGCGVELVPTGRRGRPAVRCPKCRGVAL